MFIREIVKQNKGYKKKFIYHTLMESYRTEKGPRQRLLLTLGKLNLPREKWKDLANRIEEISSNQKSILLPDEEIEPLAQHYSSLLVEKHSPKEEVLEEEPRYEEVDVHSVVNRRIRTIGAEHVSLSMLQKLGLPGIFSELGFTDIQNKIAQLLIVGRMVYPKSEWRTYQWAQDISAVGELLSFNVSDISHNRFYKISDLLVNHQEKIEESLYKEEKNLFTFTDKIILYDLANTYFESGVGKSRLKSYAPSKEKRNDCPVVTLGLVLNEAGFPKRSKVFKGNISEGKTLLKMVKELDTDKGSQGDEKRKTVIIDAGLAEEENLKALKDNNFDYICVARNKPLEEFPQDGFVTIRHTKENKIETRLVKQKEEVVLFCRSLRKRRKEEAIKNKLQEQFEADLKNALDSLHKKGGTKKYEKVLEKIGRLKERHKKIAHFYHIDVEKKKDKAVNITWKIESEVKFDERFSGSYYLRTSRTDLIEHELWELYTLLTDVEESFRSMKSELGLRPNYHQIDKRITGHLFITVLAYHTVNSILYLLHRKDIHMKWDTIRSFLSTQTRITTEMNKEDGSKIIIRSTSQPELFHNMITKALSIKSKPLNKILLKM